MCPTHTPEAFTIAQQGSTDRVSLICLSRLPAPDAGSAPDRCLRSIEFNGIHAWLVDLPRHERKTAPEMALVPVPQQLSAIVHDACRRAPTLAFPYGTTCRDHEAAHAFIVAHETAINDAFDRLRDADQIEVCIMYDLNTFRQSLPEMKHLSELEATEWADTQVDSHLGRSLRALRARIVDKLSALALEFLPAVGQASTMPGEPCAEWSFLVSRTMLERFRAEAESLEDVYRRRGLSLVVRPPRPPLGMCPCAELLDRAA